MTTATAVIDVDRPLGRTIRLVPAVDHQDHQDRQDRPEPPSPAPSADDRARTRPAHCRFAVHYED
ncbi:hypothetical protein AB0F71_25845 [Kitasatospora sp. NPDC028055]|uniref:hypothetical protein n=1 Tax=Kitasatospora sp. NPDC028055 TaxID=3155653 RepID=UPI0033CCAC4F